LFWDDGKQSTKGAIMTSSLTRPAGMLAITRRRNESIILELPDGQQIIIKRLEKHCLGISAPDDVKVSRDEHLLHGEELAAFRGKGAKTNA
jgi:sRNA-binding carbon storage regulator CsrA